VVLLATIGLKPGIDFSGGSLLEVSFSGERPEAQAMRDALAPLDLGTVAVQPAGEDGYIIKTRFVSEEEHQNVLQTIRKKFEVRGESSNEPTPVSATVDANGVITINESLESDWITVGGEDGDAADLVDENGEPLPENRVIEKRVETIGASVSSHLKSRAFSTAIVVMLAIIVYVAYAFRKVSKPVKSWKFGVTAIIALIHDVTIVMGIFVLLGYYLGVEVNIPFVVALLTILGYSVNDTIVVFDRVRENLITYGYDRFEEVVNRGVNDTLVRSLNTSVTTLLVLVALFLFGGGTIKYFSLALIAGVIVGTYSSIFLASPLLVEWEKLRRKRM
jgi:preprotein translocase subunit SecF